MIIYINLEPHRRGLSGGEEVSTCLSICTTTTMHPTFACSWDLKLRLCVRPMSTRQKIRELCCTARQRYHDRPRESVGVEKD